MNGVRGALGDHFITIEIFLASCQRSERSQLEILSFGVRRLYLSLFSWGDPEPRVSLELRVKIWLILRQE